MLEIPLSTAMDLAQAAGAGAGVGAGAEITHIIQHETLSQWFMVGLGVLGFLVTIVVTTGGTVWAVGNIKTELMKTIALHREEIDKELRLLKDEQALASQTTMSQSGEGLKAIREKVNQVELFMRDEFVRKDTFSRVVDQILAKVDANAASREAWQIRMETRIGETLKDMTKVLQALASRIPIVNGGK